jgi:dienelactone hydrolase
MISGDIKIHAVQVGRVPCLEIVPSLDGPAPLVFFSHGYESDKRDGIRLAYELAKRGLICVSFDTIWRGDREDGELDPELDLDVKGLYPPESELGTTLAFFQMVRQSGNDLQSLIDHYQQDERVDFERIGLSGYSMGGMVALFGAGFIPEFSAVAAVAGIPGSMELWNDIFTEAKSAHAAELKLKSLEVTSKDWADYIRDMDPTTRLLDYPEKPLLLMAGDQDPLSQKKYHLGLYQYLEPYYQHFPERLRLRLIEGIDHQFTAKMMIEVAEWFAEVYL